jgi:hypothetical protein
MAKGPLYGTVPIRSEVVIAVGAIPPYRATMRGAINATTQGKTAQLPTSAIVPFFGASNNLIAAVAGDDGTANAPILRGAYLIMDVNGKLGPATLADNEQIIGVAEEAAAADGDFFAYTIGVFTLVVA